MAERELLGMLQKGAAAWNRWRASQPGAALDLSGAKLVRAPLAGADVSGANLRGANLTRATLAGSNLRGADLEGAILIQVDLSDADLSAASFRRANLAGANCRRAILTGVDLSDAVVTTADLRETVLRDADLRRADLRESALRASDLSGANLEGALLHGVLLDGANLASARGVTPEQIATAGEPPAALGAVRDLERLRADLVSLKSRLPNRTRVPEALVLEFHSLLAELAVLGKPVDRFRIAEDSLSVGVDSWERTPGGEAFEVEGTRSADRSILLRNLDAVLSLLAV